MTPYGRGTALLSLAGIAVLVVCLLAWVNSSVMSGMIIVGGAGFAFLVINFFRDPERSVPSAPNVVVSPADGKIVVIKHLVEEEYLRSEAIQVSIFMSPLDVHVNRFPISGTVGMFRHIEGKYLVAFNEKASEANERTHIGVEHEGYRVLFKQIAGAVARRIVAPVVVGQRAVCGERFGMIKFGSRVDVIMPKQSVLKVSLNDRVVAGETILASYS